MPVTRETSSKRGYGSRWQKARAGYLRKNPLCVWCKKEGRIALASVVDHITPHRGDMMLFWESSNWQSLCEHHHNSHKKRLEMSGKIVGCDESGIPIDPKHHWQQG